MSPRGTKKISAAVKLRTVELYLLTGSFKLAAEALEAETGEHVHASTVRRRVVFENITLQTNTRQLLDILARMRREVEEEKAAGINLPARGSSSEALTLDEQIRTLEAFIENYRYAATGRALGIGGDAAKSRLVKILGGEKNTYPVYAKVVLETLKQERDNKK